MAITVAELAAAIRVGTSTEETAQVTRLKAVGETIIENYADAAPDAIKDEALIRLAGFLYDAPNVAYANALTGSGAASLLLPYRTHRAGIVESSGGTVRAPSTQGVDVDEVNDLIDERVEDWAEQDNTDPIPASKLANAPTGTVDNRARAAAATAQEAADQAQADAAANTQGLTNAGNDIAQLKSLTRDLEIDEVDEWNDVSDPAEMALTFITGSSVTLTQAQAASYGVSVRNPNGTDFWGAGSWIGRLPVTAVADKQKYRVQVKHTGYPDLYITGNTWELMEAGDGEAQGATYRYFLLPFFGETTANYSEEIPEILSQAHEVDHTNYTGLVAGKPAADIAATQAGSGLNQTQVDARVKAGVDDWAETGNTDPIPASKLTNAPSGLNQTQVDARVKAGVDDWAETGNTDPIPASKLTNAGGGSLTEITTTFVRQGDTSTRFKATSAEYWNKALEGKALLICVYEDDGAFGYVWLSNWFEFPWLKAAHTKETDPVTTVRIRHNEYTFGPSDRGIQQIDISRSAMTIEMGTDVNSFVADLRFKVYHN